MTQMRVVLACNGVGIPMPATFTINNQGFVSPNGTVQFQDSASRVWPVQVLRSGSLVRLKGSK
jgi:hypothetical protein